MNAAACTNRFTTTLRPLLLCGPHRIYKARHSRLRVVSSALRVPLSTTLLRAVHASELRLPPACLFTCVYQLCSPWRCSRLIHSAVLLFSPFDSFPSFTINLLHSLYFKTMAEHTTASDSFLPQPPTTGAAPGQTGFENGARVMPPPLSIPQNVQDSLNALSSPTSGGVRRAAPEPNKRALYVGGLDPRVTEDVLKQIFETTGHVQSVKIIPDKNVSTSSLHMLITQMFVFVDGSPRDHVNFNVIACASIACIIHCSSAAPCELHIPNTYT